MTKPSESNLRNGSLVLVTGGSRGLGKSMALHLAERGSDVILTYRTKADEAQEVVQSIRSMGRQSLALALDVADSKGFGDFAEKLKVQLRDTWQRDNFDALVNNAGSGTYAPFAETTEAQFDEMLNTHLRSAFFLTQRLLPLIANGGRILNVSSGLARFSLPGYAAYAAMKGGVEVLTRYLAAELGPRKITVNTIAPGAIATDFGGGVVRDNPHVNATIAAQTALGRVGVAEDIGGAVALLLSPEGRWINGQRIEVSGGIYL